MSESDYDNLLKEIKELHYEINKIHEKINFLFPEAIRIDQGWRMINYETCIKSDSHESIWGNVWRRIEVESK